MPGMWVNIAVKISTLLCYANKFYAFLLRGEGFCCTVLRFIQTLDTWKRAILYGLGAIPCFLIPIISLGGIVAGEPHMDINS